MTKDERKQLMKKALQIADELGGTSKGIILALAAIQSTLEEIYEEVSLMA